MDLYGYGFKQRLEVTIDREKDSSCESSPTLVSLLHTWYIDV